jgi:GT2 family glycosyltransferase
MPSVKFDAIMASMAPVGISVVIPTFRRPTALRRCLDALERQDTAADEILVVARRDDAESRRSVDDRVGGLVRVVLIDVPQGRPGFVAALNAGVGASRGAIVCLTDDDAEPRPDWLSRILATFDGDVSVGAVGGRDWLYEDGRLDEGSESVVGTVTWWGRTVGRHHLGVGPPRDVSILKGVNLSVRGDLIRAVGFDRRLLGRATEHHSELGLCLRLRRMGYRVVYDPAIAVDHRLQPRAVDGREFGPRALRDSVHNETLALLEFLPPIGKAAHLFWTIALGTRGAPGFGQSLRMLLSTGDSKAALLRSNLSGRCLAIGTYARGRRRRRSQQGNFARSPAPSRVS